MNVLQILGTGIKTDDKQVIKKCVYQYWNTLGKMSINLKGDELLEAKRMVFDLKAKMADDTKAILNKTDINLDDFTEAISQCKNNKSPGVDQVRNELIENSWFFSHLFSVQNFSFWSEWVAVLVPCYHDYAS